MGGNNGLKEAVSRAALREMAQVSANLSATVPESTSTDARPEQEAAERVKSGAVDTALTTGDLSLGAARAAYLRTKTMREKTLERKTAGPTDGGTREKEKPAALRDKPQTGQSIRLSTEAQRKDRVRRLLFAQKAVERQAERKSLQNTAGTAMSAPPSRLAHWQREGKRLAFQQAAMWRGQSGQNRAARGRVLPRPALRPHSFQTMRTRMQSAVGRVLNRLAAALAKTARAAVRTLAAWIGAGGIALLLVMVAGAAAAIISSPIFCIFLSAAKPPMRWPAAATLPLTRGIFCTSSFRMKCARCCWPCAAVCREICCRAAVRPRVPCNGRCRDTPRFPAGSGSRTRSLASLTRALTSPRRRVRPSLPLTAAPC